MRTVPQARPIAIVLASFNLHHLVMSLLAQAICWAMGLGPCASGVTASWLRQGAAAIKHPRMPIQSRGMRACAVQAAA